MVKCRRDGAGTAERLSFPIFFGKCIAYSIRLCVVTGKTDIRQRFCFRHLRGFKVAFRQNTTVCDFFPRYFEKYCLRAAEVNSRRYFFVVTACAARFRFANVECNEIIIQRFSATNPAGKSEVREVLCARRRVRFIALYERGIFPDKPSRR